MQPEQLMQLAIDAARRGVSAGQTPFGCAIVLGDDLVAAEHNGVWQLTDITAHAEINALRSACKKTGQILLSGAIVATTCEPCPMCMTALHWARVEAVYFGASIVDADKAGFNELRISAEQMVTMGDSRVQLVPGLLADDCRELFREWSDRADHRAY